VFATIPTALVLAGLAGAAWWGHATGWDFTSKQERGGPAPDAGSEPRPVVRTEPAPNGTGFPGQKIRIEFGSAEEIERAGIDITPAWRTALTEQVAAAGEVRFDPTRIARLPARAGGAARRVFKTTGDHVRAAEIIALIDSPEVGKAKGEFQQALVQLRLREKIRDDLINARIATTPAAIREAEAAYKDAEVRWLAVVQTLANLGLPLKPADYRTLTPAEAIRRVRFLGLDEPGAKPDATEASANLLPVRAPFAGVVLTADLVAGEVVDSGKVLFVIVDPSRVWVVLQVNLEDARRVAVGQRVFFRPDGSPREYPASVISVGTAADEKTRTVPVRAEADNAAGGLRASTLGRGRIVLREAPNALTVPHEAVRTFEGRSVVFVRDPEFLKPDGPKAFHVRLVTTGGTDARNTEILTGLSPGEIVATTGSERLLAELTRSPSQR
jgi:cobalt-zinc-cadmium efflux system membrane fusion protein